MYYESRLARLALDEAERPKIAPDFEEATEGEEVERKEKLKTRWAQLEAVVGAEKRLALVAKDAVEPPPRREATPTSATRSNKRSQRPAAKASYSASAGSTPRRTGPDHLPGAPGRTARRPGSAHHLDTA